MTILREVEVKLLDAEGKPVLAWGSLLEWGVEEGTSVAIVELTGGNVVTVNPTHICFIYPQRGGNPATHLTGRTSRLNTLAALPFSNQA